MSKKDRKGSPYDEPVTPAPEPVAEPAPSLAAPAPVYEPTVEQKQQLAAALAKGDFKTIATISKAIAAEQSKGQKSTRELAKIAEEAKKQALAQTTIIVKDMLVDHINQMRRTVAGMDKADCVVFKWNFTDADNLIECRLFKSTPRPAGKSTGGGGGATKKYAVKTEDLLDKFGDDLYDEQSGKSFREAWDSDSNGNWRYGVRVKLLKKEGVIPNK